MLDDDLITLFNWIEKGQRVVVWDRPFEIADLSDIPDYIGVTTWPPNNKEKYGSND